MTKQEMYSTNIKDHAKNIRKQLKKEFPKCEFSVTIERYSMGQSMDISLMKAPFEAIINTGSIIRDQFVSSQEQGFEFEKYAQLNQYAFKNGYSDNCSVVAGWNNGAILTPESWKAMEQAVHISQQFNYDNSDSMTDYFDVNFYLHINIGKWNKPFEKIGNKNSQTIKISKHTGSADIALSKMGLI